MTQTILQLQEAQQRNARAGGDFLGAIIGWKIAPDIRISHPELEAIAYDCDVPPELLPNPCSTARAFRSAVTEVRKDAKNFNILLRYILLAFFNLTKRQFLHGSRKSKFKLI